MDVFVALSTLIRLYYAMYSSDSPFRTILASRSHVVVAVVVVAVVVVVVVEERDKAVALMKIKMLYSPMTLLWQ